MEVLVGRRAQPWRACNRIARARPAAPRRVVLSPGGLATCSPNWTRWAGTCRAQPWRACNAGAVGPGGRDEQRRAQPWRACNLADMWRLLIWDLVVLSPGGLATRPRRCRPGWRRASCSALEGLQPVQGLGDLVDVVASCSALEGLQQRDVRTDLLRLASRAQPWRACNGERCTWIQRRHPVVLSPGGLATPGRPGRRGSARGRAQPWRACNVPPWTMFSAGWPVVLSPGGLATVALAAVDRRLPASCSALEGLQRARAADPCEVLLRSCSALEGLQRISQSLVVHSDQSCSALEGLQPGDRDGPWWTGRSRAQPWRACNADSARAGRNIHRSCSALEGLQQTSAGFSAPAWRGRAQPWRACNALCWRTRGRATRRAQPWRACNKRKRDTPPAVDHVVLSPGGLATRAPWPGRGFPRRSCSALEGLQLVEDGGRAGSEQGRAQPWRACNMPCRRSSRAS